jgi:hypothetical protein
VAKEPARTKSSQDGKQEGEFDAAMEEEMAVALAELDKETPPHPATLLAPRYFDDSFTLNIGPK